MKIYLVLIFTFIVYQGFCQIPSVFHINAKPDINNGNVMQINEELKIGTYIIKYSKIFNRQNQLVSDERHNSEGKFLAKYEYKYDSISGKKSLAKQIFAEENGTNINVNKYEYDKSGSLTTIKTYDSNNKLLSHTIVTCNELGNPIKVEKYSLDMLTGTELAEYDYPKNRATYKVYDLNGKEIHSGFFIIDNAKEKNHAEEGYEYNEMGHLIRTPEGYNLIEYDEYDNWTLITRYNIEGDKQTINQQQSRKIKYLE